MTHASPPTTCHETDALVIGAGPVGLFQVFQLGLQGIHAHVVDTLPQAGGQCLALYPEKPIYDIPGLPRCTGAELTERLRQQCAPFAPTMHWGQEVSALQRQPDGRLLVQTTAGVSFLTRTLFIAAGVGAFVPRKLRIAELDAHEGTRVFYQPPVLPPLQGPQLLVVGNGEQAVQAALALAPAEASSARCVTLVHRQDQFDAPEDDLAQLQALRQAGRVHFIAGQPVAVKPPGDAAVQAPITHLVLALDDDSERAVPFDQMLVYQGLSPRLGPLAQWGLAMERKLLTVDPATCSTSEPGIFAVGDICHYPGKRKLIVCGFHEATLAGFAAAALLRPDTPVHVQYTTTSALLQHRLGVTPDVK